MSYTNSYWYVDEDSSDKAKFFLLAYVIVSLILCGGNVFGFTPLKEILLDEQVYDELCEEGDPTPCDNQLSELDAMFTLAASLFSAYLMPAGFGLRFLGPRLCILLGFAFVSAGSLMFAKAPTSYFKIAYVCIGTGNPLLYISAFNFGKLYPKSSNLLLSIFIGCFGFSAVIFYIFNALHFTFGFDSRDVFMGFAFLPLALGIVGLVVLPPDPYHIQREKKREALLADADKSVSVSEPTETTPLKSSITSSSSTTTSTSSDVEAAKDKEPATADVPLKDRSIPQQLVSAQFVAQTLFFCFGMLQQNFYLGTIGDQIYMMAGDNPLKVDQTVAILTKFEIFYPIGCLVSILPVGAIVKNSSVSTSLFVYSLANLIFSVLALVPIVPLQWVTSELYVIVRVGFFTVMSTYSATIFGFKNLSTMFGCAGCFAGLCSLFGTFLSDRALHVDHSFFYVNCCLLVGAVLNFAFPTAIAVLKWQMSDD